MPHFDVGRLTGTQLNAVLDISTASDL